MATTACVPCRKVKMRCHRGSATSCHRCQQHDIECEIVPRKLGRQPGSKNRPKGDHIPPKGRRRSPQVPRRVSPLQITSPASIFSESLADLAAASPLAEGEAPPGASFNMLNVLARVANDQPEVYPQPVFTPGSIESEPPFDRDSFLAEFRAEAATLDADPYAGVAILEAGLAELYPLSIESVPTGEVMYERLDYPRLDVGDAYDLVTCGILTLNEIHGLADVYWNRIQPVCRVLDPDIHTVDYLLSQSSLLATVVIATAAQCLPVSELANSIVARLEAHIDFLLTEIDKHGFQSTEICQALTLFCLFMGGHQLQRTWGLTARAIAIAIELHIDVSPPPEWVFVQSTHHSASAVALQRNVERVWMLLVDWDRACAFIRGRRPMICQPAQVDPERLFTWCTLPGAHKADPYTAGFVVLLDIVGRLQFQTARQLMQQGRQFDFGAHSAQVEALLDAWKAKWIALFLEEDRHRSLLDVEGLRLIVLMMPYEYGVRHRWPTSTTGAGRETCLSTAKAIIIQALPILGGTETVVKVSSLYTYRYYRIAYAGFTALRMINTAPGSRNADVYILSIVSALAQRLIDVRIHSNIAKVTVLLGRRLLQAARHLAGTRLTTEVPLSVDFGDGVAWLVTEDEGELQFPALNGVFGTLDPFNFERQDWGSLPESFFDELGL